MQLVKLSLAAAILATSCLADDYISVQHMYYDEDSGRATVNSPSVEINKEIGVDYTLNFSYTHDGVSGATPTFYKKADASSGASAKTNTKSLNVSDIRYGNVAYDDKRDAYSFSLAKRFASRDELSVGFDYSGESDYISREISLQYAYNITPDRNSVLTVGFSHQKNYAKVFCDYYHLGCMGEITKPLNVNTYEVGLTQVIDKTSLIKASIFHINEHGYLSNPYMNVVRDYYTTPKIIAEHKPDGRKSYGVKIEYEKALNEKISIVPSYRYYNDDWGIDSHTCRVVMFDELSPKLRMKVGFRYYTQTNADFYNDKVDFFTNQTDASSDKRVGSFESTDWTIGFRYKINPKLLINAALSYYEQDDFDAIYSNIGLVYKF